VRPWQIRLIERADAPSLAQLNPSWKDCVMGCKDQSCRSATRRETLAIDLVGF
jgi:hypothetical protein